MVIGRFVHRVELQMQSAAPDAGGGLTQSYATIATVWGRMEALASALFDGARQVERGITHRLRLRWREDWTLLHAVRFGGRRFAIRGGRPLDDRNRFLELRLEELGDA